MRALLLTLLIAGQALAQNPLPGRGPRLMVPAPTASTLSAVQYTTADQTYYVDPAGSDSAAGTIGAPLATCQAAVNRSPKVLRHKLTINLVAGNHAGCVIAGFTLDPGVQKATAGILLDGVLANVTPTTGTATGTAESGAAGVQASSYGTLVDAEATWTTNDTALVGSFVIITGGTGAGQSRVIISNTGTVLTVAGVWTALSGTSTYAIQRPSAIITSSTALIPRAAANSAGTTTGLAAAGLQIINNNMDAHSSGASIVVRNMALNVGGSTAGALVAGSQAFFILTTANGGSASGIAVSNGSFVNLDVVSATTTGAGIGAASSTDSLLNITRSLLTASGSTGGAGVRHLSSKGTLEQTKMAVSGGAQGVLISRNSGVTSNSLLTCDCASGATSACIRSGLSSSLPQGGADDIALAADVSVTDCTYGLMVQSGNISLNGALTGNALSYGAHSIFGGNIRIKAASATLTATTAEMAVDDGAVTGTFGSLGATYACIVATTGTVSRVCRL